MGTITDALTWSGSGATLSLFGVFVGSAPSGVFKFMEPRCRLDVFALDEDAATLPGRSTVEYDFVFDTLPGELQDVLIEILEQACAGGAVVAWFGFEGSFNFENLLTAVAAPRVYGLVDTQGVALACDEDLPTAEWRQRVVTSVPVINT